MDDISDWQKDILAKYSSSAALKDQMQINDESITP